MEESGGALRRSGRTSPTPSPPEPAASRADLEQRRSGGAVRTSRGISAGGASGQPRRDASTPLSSPRVSPKVVVNSFAKRKATVQWESLQDSGEALKEKERDQEGLQPRILPGEPRLKGRLRDPRRPRKLISKLLLLERQTSPLIMTPSRRKNLRSQGSRRVKETRLSGSRARKLQK